MAVAQRFFVINCSKYHHRVWYTTIGYTFVKLYLPCTIYLTGLRENNASLHGIVVLKFKLNRNSFFIYLLFKTVWHLRDKEFLVLTN